jgi:hypothetical protein
MSADLFANAVIDDICADLKRELVEVVRAYAELGYIDGQLVGRKARSNRRHIARMVEAGATQREAADRASRCWDAAAREVMA